MFFGSSYFLKIYLCLGVFLYFIRFFCFRDTFRRCLATFGKVQVHVCVKSFCENFSGQNFFFR